MARTTKGASKKSVSKKRHKKKLIILGVEILLLLVVLLALVLVLKMSKIDSGNKLDEEKIANDNITEETKERLKNHTTIAIFGLDNRSNGNFDSGNSDMIMLANINKDTKEVTIVSVYRDTYLDRLEGKGMGKCNAAFAYGGAERAVAMLNENLDLNISEYVIVDFNAVTEAVDLLGGVEITVTDEEAYWMQMYIDEISKVVGKKTNYLPGAGTYNLDGIQATAYARVRYTAGDDFKRTERQRLVLQKMIEKALDSDLSTINSLVNEVFEEIETSFTIGELLLLAKDAFSYEVGEMSGFPFDKLGTDIEGAGSCVIPLTLESNVQKLHALMYGEMDYQVSDKVKNLSDKTEKVSGLGIDDIP